MLDFYCIFSLFEMQIIYVLKILAQKLYDFLINSIIEITSN